MKKPGPDILTGIGCDGAGAANRTWRARSYQGERWKEDGSDLIYRVFMNDEDYVVVYADSPEEAVIKLRDAGLERVKVEPFDAYPRLSKGAAPAR